MQEIRVLTSENVLELDTVPQINRNAAPSIVAVVACFSLFAISLDIIWLFGLIPVGVILAVFWYRKDYKKLVLSRSEGEALLTAGAFPWGKVKTGPLPLDEMNQLVWKEIKVDIKHLLGRQTTSAYRILIGERKDSPIFFELGLKRNARGVIQDVRTWMDGKELKSQVSSNENRKKRRAERAKSKHA